MNIKLKAPRTNTFWIAVIVGGIGILAQFLPIPMLSGSGLPGWLISIGFVLLVLGNLLKGL